MGCMLGRQFPVLLLTSVVRFPDFEMGCMLNNQWGDRDKINKIGMYQGRVQQPGTTGNPVKTTVVLWLSGLEARAGGLASGSWIQV